MPLAQERHHESGDGGVLTDDDLGHLRAEGDQRVAGTAFRWAAAHRLVVSFALCSSRSSSSARRTRAASTVRTLFAPLTPAAPYPSAPSAAKSNAATAGGGSPVRAATAATSASGVASRFEMHERRQTGAASLAQGGGGGVARARRGVEPSAAEHRLGGPDHHGKRLGDDRSRAGVPARNRSPGARSRSAAPPREWPWAAGSRGWLRRRLAARCTR